MLLSKMQKGLLLFLLLVLAILTGAAVPLFHTPVLTEQTKQQLDCQQFYADGPGADRAMLLEQNGTAWTERLRLLNQAQEQIVLTTFDMRDSHSTRDITAVLLQKANDGVSVKILVDGLNGWFHLEQSPLFRALAAHPNIEIKLYNPVHVARPWLNQYRLHDKFVIVDDLGYILGGRNTHDYFIGDYDTDSRSLDREVLVYNTRQHTARSGESSIAQLQQYFDTMWNSDYCKHYGEKDAPLQQQEKLWWELEAHYNQLVQQHAVLFQDNDFMRRTVPANRITLLYNNPDMVAKEPEIFYQLCRLMGQAQEQVTFFSPYAICNQYMINELQQISAQVPDCRLVINSVENGDNFFASADYLRHKADVLQSGFAVYEYDGGTSTHGKSLTIDNRLSVIGSYNLDLRSTYLSTETMVVIDSTELTAQLNQNFHAMEQDSRQLIGPDDYIVPDNVRVADVSTLKRVLWKVVGVVVQPFRLML